MVEISSELYETAASRLLEALDDRDYFSGHVDICDDGIEGRLTASLIVYHAERKMPEGSFTVIDDIVPVWWEFTTLRNGAEELNDFSFAALKEFIFRE